MHLETDSPNTIRVMLSVNKKDKKCTAYHLIIPSFDKYFSGTGDLTASLFYGWWKKQKDIYSVRKPLFNTLATVNAIVSMTYDMNSNELLLIEGQSYIRYPPINKFKYDLTIREYKLK